MEALRALVLASNEKAPLNGEGAIRFLFLPGRGYRRDNPFETRGFMMALIGTESDRILGFTVFGVEAGEIMDSVQIAMIAGLPYTALRDAILTHPTLLEGLVSLFPAVRPN
jgi:pyruvate/2-oxoglutarate dehydrogenase complex dihydrolipoamide dehydrogenase (E3) component